MNDVTHMATLLAAGLLADHKDHEDERLHIVVKPNRFFPIGHLLKHSSQVHEVAECTRLETCAEAVARLAFDQAEALLAEGKKRGYHEFPA